MDEYRFVVRGLPQPKGSARGFPYRGKDGRQRIAITSDNPKMKSWEDLIRFQVQDFEGLPWEGPIGLELHFYLPRPKSAPKRVTLPATRPDQSKLLRSVEDALTGVVYRDDAQICRTILSKDFATEFVGVEGRVWKVAGGGHEALVLPQASPGHAPNCAWQSGRLGVLCTCRPAEALL